MTIPKIGTGTTDDPFRPDLPEGTAYRVVRETEGGYEVELLGPAALEHRFAAFAEQVEARTREHLDRVADRIEAAQESLTPAERKAIADELRRRPE